MQLLCWSWSPLFDKLLKHNNMEMYNICQSCGMPINNPHLRGSEKNGFVSHEYCMYCYKDGEFTQPVMTREEMRYNVRRRLQEQHMSAEMIDAAVTNVRFLNRWLRRPVEKIKVQFEYNGFHYEAVIRVRKNPGAREFHITILNWELERLLYNNAVISEVDGVLQANILADKVEQTKLKLSIALKLSEYLKVQCFVGECLLSTVNDEGWERQHPIPRHEHLPYSPIE
jgi:hypothetical protein